MKNWKLILPIVFCICASPVFADVEVAIKIPMPPPTWALMERELLRTQTNACRKFFQKYFDERGYLLCTERWGALDGPDDAIENLRDWPILHSLGASEDVLRMYRKAWEGHLRQYTRVKTTDVEFAREGMYFKEFHTLSPTQSFNRIEIFAGKIKTIYSYPLHLTYTNPPPQWKRETISL